MNIDLWTNNTGWPLMFFTGHFFFMALWSVVCFYSSRTWFLLTQWGFFFMQLLWECHSDWRLLSWMTCRPTITEDNVVMLELNCPTPHFSNAFTLTLYNIMSRNSIHRGKENMDSISSPLSLIFLFSNVIFSPGCLGCDSFKGSEESRANSFLTFLYLPWPFRPATVGCQQLGYSQRGWNVLLRLT